MTPKKIESDLQAAFLSAYNIKNKSISFPENISVYNEDNNTYRLHIKSDYTSKNMQTNENAIDSWALILNRWLGKNIILDWDFPKNICDLHYQRFLYRINEFERYFNPLISLSQNAKNNLNDLRINENEEYYTNSPSKTNRNKPVKIPLKSEDDYEVFFLQNSQLFNSVLQGATKKHSFFRQLPVGLFKKEVFIPNAIFTHKKSAIDLISWDKDNLFIYELKKPNNKSIGIISELFFYTRFMSAVIKKQFLLPKKSNLQFSNIKSIKSYMLVKKDNIHPLIDKELLNFLNTKDLFFGVIFYEFNNNECSLTEL